MDTISIQPQWILLHAFCTLTGYTPKAIRRKIEDGKWIEGRIYRRAPDGHITVNLQEYYRWVEGAQQLSKAQEQLPR